MLLKFLSPLISFFGNIPREIYYLAAAIALLLWIDGRAYDRGYSDRDAEAQEEARLAAERAREADAAANDTVTERQTDVEAGNDRARNAADGSNDPLRDGLDSLRP